MDAMHDYFSNDKTILWYNQGHMARYRDYELLAVFRNNKVWVRTTFPDQRFPYLDPSNPNFFVQLEERIIQAKVIIDDVVLTAQTLANIGPRHSQ